MIRPRVAETNNGIQNMPDVEAFDRFKRKMRDRRLIETDMIIKSGIIYGDALEIGPGPGYVGLEWLKKTKSSSLIGVEISPAMIAVAGKNAAEYGLSARTKYTCHNAVDSLPFENNSFDGVFATGSLHEWETPGNIFNEIYRVLKPGGRYFVSDLRRDISAAAKWLMLALCQRGIRRGFLSSLGASYTPGEIRLILDGTDLRGCDVKKDLMGLAISGAKARAQARRIIN